MISKKYNEQMGNYIAKLARESKPQTNADICPHYRPNHHDRGDDSLCDRFMCEVKALPRWIPVSNRLPDKTSQYLVQVYVNRFGEGMHSETDVMFYNTVNGYFSPLCGGCIKSAIYGEVTHWMPLPPPPQEGEE